MLMDIDIKPELKCPSLTPIFLTGLDVVYNANHKAIWDSFCNNRKPNQLPINFKIQPLDHSYPKPHTKRINYEWYIPKGILKRYWFAKHQNLIPSVVVFFYELDWDDASWDEKKLECGTRLNILRESLQNRITKIIVVLIQSKSHFPPGEDMLSTEKAADFCNTCNVPSKHLFVLPFSDLFYGYTLKLEGAFYEIAQAYYNEKIKNIKSHASYLNKNLHQALIVRYNIKAGFFNEMKQDQNLALKCYMQAYECLADMRVPENNLLEVKVVAGYINYKVCKLYFEKNSPLEAIMHFRKHLELYKNKMGCPDVTFEHYAWMESQYKHFGELFQNAVGAGLLAIQTQHPGFYFVQAAQETHQRRHIIRSFFQQMDIPPAYPSPDPLQGQDDLEYYGQRPWKQGNLNTEHFDINKEKLGILALQLREWATDYSSIIISLLKTALPQFEQRSPRLKNYLLMRIGLELFDTGDYTGCLGISNTLVQEFRRGKWWLLFTTSLLTALKCSYLLADITSYLTYCMELIGDKSFVNAQEKVMHQRNFTRILHCAPPDPPFNLGTNLDPSVLPQIQALWETSLAKFLTVPVPQHETPSSPIKIILNVNELNESFIKVDTNLEFRADRTFGVTLGFTSSWQPDQTTAIELDLIESIKLFYTVSLLKCLQSVGPVHTDHGASSDQKLYELYYDFCTGASRFNNLCNTGDLNGSRPPAPHDKIDGMENELANLKLKPVLRDETFKRALVGPYTKQSATLPLPHSLESELLTRGGEVRLNGLIVELASDVGPKQAITDRLMVYLKWALPKVSATPVGERQPVPYGRADVEQPPVTAVNLPPCSDPLFSAVKVEIERPVGGKDDDVPLSTDEIFEMDFVINYVPGDESGHVNRAYEYTDFQIDLHAIINPVNPPHTTVMPSNALTSLSVTNKIDPFSPMPTTGTYKEGKKSGGQDVVTLYMSQDKGTLSDHCTKLRNQILHVPAAIGDGGGGKQNFGLSPNGAKITFDHSGGSKILGGFDISRSTLKLRFYAVLVKNHPDTVSLVKFKNDELPTTHHFTLRSTVVCRGRLIGKETSLDPDDAASHSRNCVFQGLSPVLNCDDPFVIKPHLLTHMQLNSLGSPPPEMGNLSDITNYSLTAPTFVLSIDLATNPKVPLTKFKTSTPRPPFILESYDFVEDAASVARVIFDGLCGLRKSDGLKLGNEERANLSFLMAVKSGYLRVPKLAITTLGWLLLIWKTLPKFGETNGTGLDQDSRTNHTLYKIVFTRDKGIDGGTTGLTPRLTYDNSCPVVLNLSIQHASTGQPEPPKAPPTAHWYRVHDTLRLAYTLTNTSPTLILTGRMTMGVEEEEPSFFIFAGCKQRTTPFRLMPAGGTYKFTYNAIPVHLGRQRLPKMAIEIDGYPQLPRYGLLENTVPYVYIYPSNHIGHAYKKQDLSREAGSQVVSTGS